MRWTLMVVLIGSIAFSMTYGGGGVLVGYLPGDVVKLPIDFNLKFEDGVVILGGYGGGGVGWYSGGMGGGGERTLKDASGNEYVLDVGFGMGYFYKRLGWKNLGLEAGIGIGDLSVGLSRIVNEGSTDIGSFVEGRSEGKLDMSIDYVSIFPVLSLTLKVVPFLEISAHAIGVLGYSFWGWKFETGTPVDLENQDRFFLGYTLCLGLSWGF